MALISVVGWLTVVTVLFVWAVLKILKWALNTERDDVRNYIPWLYDAYKLFLLAVLLLTFGDGIGSWLVAVWNAINTLL